MVMPQRRRLSTNRGGSNILLPSTFCLATALFLLVANYYLVPFIVHRGRGGRSAAEVVGKGGGGILASLAGFVPRVATAENNMRGDAGGMGGWLTDGTTDAVVSDMMIAAPNLVELMDIHKRLVQSNDGVDMNVNGEWDRRYSLMDVIQSDTIADMLRSTVEDQADEVLSEKHFAAKQSCAKSGADVLKSGGWCLTPRVGGEYIGSIITGNSDNATFVIPKNHMVASSRLVSEILTLIEDEKVASVNDFGGGVGQYKEAILQQGNGQHVLPDRTRPEVEWKSYDGAGNVLDYTKGFVNYFDLTLPLELHKADWVVALEVGDHVPNQYEGMMIRNLHHHNCKGIILSWAVVGQDGHSHVNNHSNDCVISIFKELGYVEDLNLKAKLRNPVGNYAWFVGSTMAFRRLVASSGCPIQ